MPAVHQSLIRCMPLTPSFRVLPHDSQSFLPFPRRLMPPHTASPKLVRPQHPLMLCQPHAASASRLEPSSLARIPDAHRHTYLPPLTRVPHTHARTHARTHTPSLAHGHTHTPNTRMHIHTRTHIHIHTRYAPCPCISRWF